MGILDHNDFWRDFETAITALHKSFGTAVHNVKLTGKSKVKHQIDVVFKKRVGLYAHLTLVSCKYWSTKVKKAHVLEWKSIVEDCSASSGAIFSKKGFQSGAITYARHHNIKLFHILELSDKDWDGYLKTINIRFQIAGRRILEVIPEMEVNASKPIETVQVLVEAQNGHLYNENKEIVGNLIDEINALANAAAETYVQKIYAEPLYIIVNADFRKLKSLSMRLEFYESPQHLQIDFAKDYPFRLIELTTGIEYPISKEGIVKIDPD